MSTFPRLVYVAPWLPKLSETFVYKEVIGLRSIGLHVATASVHQPSRAWSEPELRRMSDESVPIYGAGLPLLVRDALMEFSRHPVMSISTMGMAIRDAAFGKQLTGVGRLKVVWQGLAALGFAYRLRAEMPDHLHAHMAHVATTIAMYTAHQLKLGFSFSGHAADVFRDRSLLEEKLQRADFVRCISEWHRSYYQSIAPRPDDQYPVIRCGVAIADTQRTKLQSASLPPLILGVGRLVPKKGFDLLIRAVSVITQMGQSCRCHIVGDGPEMAGLQALANELKLNNVVEFKGAMDNAAILELLPRADLFVLPCRTDKSGDKDGIPVVLMEAMASRVCVVSGDLETIRELISPMVSGCLTPPDDVQALTNQILELLRDEVLRDRLAEAGQKKIKEEFSLDLNVKRMQATFCRQRLASCN